MLDNTQNIPILVARIDELEKQLKQSEITINKLQASIAKMQYLHNDTYQIINIVLVLVGLIMVLVTAYTFHQNQSLANKIENDLKEKNHLLIKDYKTKLAIAIDEYKAIQRINSNIQNPSHDIDDLFPAITNLSIYPSLDTLESIELISAKINNMSITDFDKEQLLGECRRVRRIVTNKLKSQKIG